MSAGERRTGPAVQSADSRDLELSVADQPGVIAGVELRRVTRDGQQYYCANDVHRASGGEKRHSVSYWMRSRIGQELIAALNTEIPVFSSKGRGGGTYAIAEVIVAYAAWISAAFHAHVLRTFLAAQQQQQLQDLATTLRLAADAIEKTERLQLDSDALRRLTESEGSFTPTQAAKSLDKKPQELFQWLALNRWLYRSGDGRWCGYQSHIDAGHLRHKITTITHDGGNKAVQQVRITPAGLELIAKRLASREAE